MYDKPFFKRLVKNDLGIDTHQGGPYIPRALLPFLPPLPTGSSGPTEEYFITLDLFDGPTPVGTAICRWHYQTWGRSRTPEHRLTQNIVPMLLGHAAVGDILMFERQIDAVDRYRVTLLRVGTTEYINASRAVGVARWGSLGESPLDLTPLETELQLIAGKSLGTFHLFQERPLGDLHRRLLRDAAFSRLVKRAYDHKCAACGIGYLVPVGVPGPDPISEPEAAHIVPVSLLGADDLRNAMCLCRAHHWAFDRKVIFLDENFVWQATTDSKKENRNASLNDIEGTPFIPPRAGYAPPAQEAVAWHRERVLAG